MNRSTRNIITFALMLAMFLAAIEVTIVNAAMPTVVSALGGISLYSWVFSAFMLANTTTVPIYGKLADLYGRKNVFIIAISLFVTGSALCGFSQSMGQLVFFRAIQGLGAGGVLPIALTIVGDIFPFETRSYARMVFIHLGIGSSPRTLCRRLDCRALFLEVVVLVQLATRAGNHPDHSLIPSQSTPGGKC